jgi:methionine-rich copper-binding protein CopC
MPRPAPAASRHAAVRPVATLAVALLVAFLGTLGTATPASAHTALKSSSPADGATLTAAPESVRLAFTGKPSSADLAVTLDNEIVPLAGPVRVDGSEVVAQVSLPGPGTYTVAYRIVSSDGHPVQGTTRFTVAGAAGGASASPAAEAAPTPSASAATGPVPPPEDTSRWPHLVIALVLLVLVGIAVALATGPKPPKRNRY